MTRVWPSAQCSRDPHLKRGKHSRFKPRVFLEPRSHLWGKDEGGRCARQEILIRFDCLSQIFVLGTEICLERIVSKIDGELQGSQERKQFPMPLMGTLAGGAMLP